MKYSTIYLQKTDIHLSIFFSLNTDPCFTALGYLSIHLFNQAASVWPPDRFFVIIMDEITLCCEETQGFDLVHGDFVF